MLEFVDESGTSSRIADWVKPDQIKSARSVAEDFHANTNWRLDLELDNLDSIK
jgi:hypothetical protein